MIMFTPFQCMSENKNLITLFLTNQTGYAYKQ